MLIVDGDFDSAEVLSVTLAGSGLQVRIALEAAEALAVANELVPDVIILEVGYPLGEGYELAARLRAIPALYACRFIALTGYVADGLAERSKQAGFEVHLTKPVAPHEILRVLRARGP